MRELTLLSPLSLSAQSVRDQIRASENSIAIHVRRGDFLTSKRAVNPQGVCSPRYYADSLFKLRGLLSQESRLFVFSDDIPWCESFPPIVEQLNVVFVRGLTPEEDLELIKTCRHQIISNSTFGWWGAWLSNEIGGIRIAPEPWNDDRRLRADDIIPRTWLRLPK